MTESMRDRIARAIHCSPNAQKQLRDAGVQPHTWDECDNGVDTRDQYHADADTLLAAFPWLADEPRDAEVEAGARALFESDCPTASWATVAAGVRARYETDARVVLSAARSGVRAE